MKYTELLNTERNLELEKFIQTIPRSKMFDKYSFEELRLAMHYQAMYCLPTAELIEFFRQFKYFGECIEIGAGNGLIAQALDITATDSYMQNRPEVIVVYEASQQPMVKYGKNVKKIEGEKAIEKYKPDVVFSSWITPKFDNNNQYLNMYGMIEERIVKKVEFYIQVCGEVHYTKPIMQLPHVKIHADWIRGRSKNDNYICIYSKSLAILTAKLNAIQMDFTPTLCNYEPVCR